MTMANPYPLQGQCTGSQSLIVTLDMTTFNESAMVRYLGGSALGHLEHHLIGKRRCSRDG
jgi:hypothetical protein